MVPIVHGGTSIHLGVSYNSQWVPSDPQIFESQYFSRYSVKTYFDRQRVQTNFFNSEFLQISCFSPANIVFDLYMEIFWISPIFVFKSYFWFITGVIFVWFSFHVLINVYLWPIFLVQSPLTVFSLYILHIVQLLLIMGTMLILGLWWFVGVQMISPLHYLCGFVCFFWLPQFAFNFYIAFFITLFFLFLVILLYTLYYLITMYF